MKEKVRLASAEKDKDREKEKERNREREMEKLKEGRKVSGVVSSLDEERESRKSLGETPLPLKEMDKVGGTKRLFRKG